MRATKVSAHSESQRMFENGLFEFFSRIPGWQPPAIFIPIIGWSSWMALVEMQVGVLTFLGLLIGGALTWSLIEYWLHRKLFHYEPTSKFGKRMFWLLHGVHHDWPYDRMRLVFPPALSIPIAIGLWYGTSAIFGPVLRYSFYSGLGVGYLSYDMIHYYVHHFNPKNPVGKFLRRYHLAHHFKDPNSGFGVSHPLWDYVFGTVPQNRD